MATASWSDVLLWLKRLVWGTEFVDAYLSGKMDFRLLDQANDWQERFYGGCVEMQE